MALASGTRLGPYRVVAHLGAGGMGDVYRAHDERLDREVALKILPTDVANDHERLARFEREARASAALNHPNIVITYDIGQAEGVTYVALELLDGATLRDELARHPPTSRKAIEWTIDIARGLSAAHAKGIVHRDIKPENLFVTRDGRVKILDFGIASVAAAAPGGTGEGMTVAAATEPGKVLGTAGYMSPEQVRGEPVDARSDIFALGAVLYEMLAGKRPFAGDTAVETMHAVLKSDPPEFAQTTSVSTVLDRIVRRCLEKRPDDRFHSAHDLALALEAVTDTRTQPQAVVSVRPARPRALLFVAAAVAIAALSAVMTAWSMRSGAGAPLPTIREVTVRRGTIHTARFSSAGDSVIYSAQFGAAASAPFETHLNSPEARQIGPANSLLFAASQGAIALGLRPIVMSGRFAARLASMPRGASAAREIADRIVSADFVGDDLAAIEYDGNVNKLHFPIGKIIGEYRGGLGGLRASPDGQTIAMLDDRGIVLIRRDGTSSRIDVAATSVVWSPAGGRLWFSTDDGRGSTSIWSVTPGRAPDEVWRTTGNLVIDDIATDGRLLLRGTEFQGGTLVVRPGVEEPEDFSWLDRSYAVAVSPTGAMLMNDIDGVYLRRLDGSPAIKLSAGRAVAFSEDGQFALVQRDAQGYYVVPVGPGSARELTHPGIESFFAWFHPDAQRVMINGRTKDGTWRHFAISRDGSGGVQPLGPENFEHYAGQIPLSNDGKWLFGYPLPARTMTVIALDGSESIAVRGKEADEAVIRFAEGDREIFVFKREGLPARVFRVDFRTGARRLWREFQPGDPAGISGIPSIAMTADGTIMAFNYRRFLSTLYEVGGLVRD